LRSLHVRDADHTAAMTKNTTNTHVARMTWRRAGWFLRIRKPIPEF